MRSITAFLLFIQCMSFTELAQAFGSGKTGTFKVKKDSSDEVNLREACRRVASGMYLDAWDQMYQSKKLLASTEAKKKAIDLSLSAESKLLTAMRSKVAKSNYDLALAQQIDSKSGLIHTLQTQAADMATLGAKSKVDVDAATKYEAARRAEVIPVFDIKKEKKQERPLNLDYKAACPKYRYLCPLPRDHAIRLRDITDKNPNLEPCTRYAEQSIQNRK